VFQLAGASLGGWLWSRHGSAAAFGLGMLGAAASLLAILRWPARR